MDLLLSLGSMELYGKQCKWILHFHSVTEEVMWHRHENTDSACFGLLHKGGPDLRAKHDHAFIFQWECKADAGTGGGGMR